MGFRGFVTSGFGLRVSGLGFGFLGMPFGFWFSGNKMVQGRSNVAPLFCMAVFFRLFVMMGVRHISMVKAQVKLSSLG